VTSLAAVLVAGSASNNAAPGALGFIVIAAMGGALVLLLLSMNKHLRRVRAVRDAGLEPGSQIDADSAGSGPRPATGAATTGSPATPAGEPAVPDKDR
jgi:hypothetical protein